MWVRKMKESAVVELGSRYQCYWDMNAHKELFNNSGLWMNGQHHNSRSNSAPTSVRS